MRNALSLFLFLCILTGCGTGDAIRPARQLPKTTPWDLKALSAPPAFEWVDDKSPVRSLMYTGESFKGKPTKVFAYYATPGTLAGDPSKDIDLPGVVLVHGGGGTAFREWAELWAKRGYAAIAMDLRGQRPVEGVNPHDPKNRQDLPDGGPMQSDENIFFNIDEPKTEHWPDHAVANVIRGHSLLRSFPEVDAKRTAITGISWGGYLTCIVASLDNRFKAAVPVYGCGFLHENSAWLDQFGKLGPEKAAKWVELYDPSRYLPACRVPIFFVNGTNDFAYPLDSYMKSYNLVRCEKNIRITVNMPHGHPPGWEPKEIGMFIDEKLRGVNRLSMIVDVGPNPKILTHGSRITSIDLHHTVGTEPINKRSWVSGSIPMDKRSDIMGMGTDGVHMPLGVDLQIEPPPGATAWFITGTDDRGATVSSEVVIPSK